VIVKHGAVEGDARPFAIAAGIAAKKIMESWDTYQLSTKNASKGALCYENKNLPWIGKLFFNHSKKFIQSFFKSS